MLEQAFLERRWMVRFGRLAFEMTAYVSLFFGGSMIVAMTPKFRDTTLLATANEALEHLRTRLGADYHIDPLQPTLVRGVRGGTPRVFFAELARVERALGSRTQRRLGASSRDPDRHRWQLVEALRSGWRIIGVRPSRIVGGDDRMLWASIGVGPAGLTPSFTGWFERQTQRWAAFREATIDAFEADGFQVAKPSADIFHAGRLWRLSAKRVVEQATAFDALVDAGLVAQGVSAARARPRASISRRAGTRKGKRRS